MFDDVKNAKQGQAPAASLMNTSLLNTSLLNTIAEDFDEGEGAGEFGDGPGEGVLSALQDVVEEQWSEISKVCR